MATQCNDGSYVESVNGASTNQTLTAPTISGGQASNVRIVGGRIVGAALENTIIAVDAAGLPILAGEALARAGDVAAALSGAQGRLTDCSGADLADGAQIATCAQMQAAIDARIAEVVGAAPAAFDTLAEIDAQMAADQTAAAALAALVAGKQGQLKDCAGADLPAGANIPTCAQVSEAAAATLTNAKSYADAADVALATAIAGKQATLTWATQAQIQAGTGTQNPIDPATLKAAFGAAVSWPVKASVSSGRAAQFISATGGVAVYAESTDGGSAAVSALVAGTGAASAVSANVTSTGNGNAVLGTINASGGGNGVAGLVYGAGSGSGTYGVIYGLGTGNGATGTVSSNANGDGVAGFVYGNGLGNGVRGYVGGAGAGSALYGRVGLVAGATGTGYAVYGSNGAYGTRLAVGGFFLSGANTTWGVYTNGSIYTLTGMTSGGAVSAPSFVTTSDERLKRNIGDIPEKAAIEFSRRLRFVGFDKLTAAEPIKSDYERRVAEWERSINGAKTALTAALDAEKAGGGNGKENGDGQANGAPSTSADLKAGLDLLMKDRPPEPDLSDEALTIGHQAGVIAQEVAKLAAEMGYGEWIVQTGPDGYLHVDMASLMAVVARGNQLRLAALEAMVR